MSAAAPAVKPPAAPPRLELPVAYHTVAAVALVVPLAGALLATLPHSSRDTHVFVGFFVLMVWLGYRSLVAHNAHQALLMTFCGLLLWAPFALVFGFDERNSWEPARLTELVSFRVLFATQFVNAFASGIALFAFRPRTEGLPEARVTS